jgi:exodeoxyribonuclease V alpha subunit
MSVVNVNGSVAEYFSLLREMRGISPIAEKMLNLLCALQQKPQLSFEAQKVLLIYLSLLEDGNTRIPLDAEGSMLNGNRSGTVSWFRRKAATL